MLPQDSGASPETPFLGECPSPGTKSWTSISQGEGEFILYHSQEM